MSRASLFLALVSAALAGCSASTSETGRNFSGPVITEEEILSSGASSAYEAIQRLRANFLSYRGETSVDPSRSSPYPTVYVDGLPYGEIASLTTIRAGDIASIRLYRSWEATTRFGLGNMGGVIEILTKR